MNLITATALDAAETGVKLLGNKQSLSFGRCA
jgi:hypothetical protein